MGELKVSNFKTFTQFILLIVAGIYVDKMSKTHSITTMQP